MLKQLVSRPTIASYQILHHKRIEKSQIHSLPSTTPDDRGLEHCCFFCYELLRTTSTDVLQTRTGQQSVLRCSPHRAAAANAAAMLTGTATI